MNVRMNLLMTHFVKMVMLLMGLDLRNALFMFNKVSPFSYS